MSEVGTERNSAGPETSLELMRTQRSHVVFVLSNPESGRDQEFLDWYRGAYRHLVSKIPGVLSVRQYERHEVDITNGEYEPLPFTYLGLYEVSFDGASGAAGLLQRIAQLHMEQPAAQAPAVWLYYPASEKVGRSPGDVPSMLTLAFANGLPGREGEFREWYATRHIRHALNIGALVSGQCFERTEFQIPGSLEAKFSTIAVYEQIGPPEAIIESFATLPDSTFLFPTLDTSRFAESVYRPLGWRAQ
jgi:hypothetical protein